MKSYGLTEASGSWFLDLPDTILFDKNGYRLRLESEKQIKETTSKPTATGLNHVRLDDRTDNYGEDSYNEALSLKRVNVVTDAWAQDVNIPRTNLTTQGLRKKYPIASNQISKDRIEDRRVVVVITVP